MAKRYFPTRSDRMLSMALAEKDKKGWGNYKENNEIGSKKPRRKEENLSKLLTNVSDILNAYPAKVFTGIENLNSRKNVSGNADVLADSFMSPQKVPTENLNSLENCYADVVDPYQPVSLDETDDFVRDPVQPFMSLPTVSFTLSTLSDFDIEETAVVDEILANGVNSLDFDQSAMFEENNEPSMDVIWTVKCLLLEVDRNIRNETLSAENKKPTTAFRSKEDISAKNLMK